MDDAALLDFAMVKYGSFKLPIGTEKKDWIGTSGKITLFFKNPVKWKYTDENNNYDSSFRFIFSDETLKEFEKRLISSIILILITLLVVLEGKTFFNIFLFKSEEGIMTHSL